MRKPKVIKYVLIDEDGLRLNLPKNKLYPQYVGNIILMEI